MTHLVRATQEPSVVREIEDAELLDLARQGLLFSYEHTPAAAAVLNGTVKTPGKWKAANRGDEIVTAPAATTDTETDDDESDDDDDTDAGTGAEKGE